MLNVEGVTALLIFHTVSVIYSATEIPIRYWVCLWNRGQQKDFAHLDPHHHVQVALAVLFDDVANVVRFTGLLEFPPRHEVLDLPDRPDGVSMRLGQPGNRGNKILF